VRSAHIYQGLQAQQIASKISQPNQIIPIYNSEHTLSKLTKNSQSPLRDSIKNVSYDLLYRTKLPKKYKCTMDILHKHHKKTTTLTEISVVEKRRVVMKPRLKSLAVFSYRQLYAYNDIEN